MKIINPKNIDTERTAHLIKRGKILIISTDTSYGIAGEIRPEIVKKIFKIKKRPFKKSIPIFVNKKIVQDYALVDKGARILIKKFWPGALTLVLKAKPGKLKFLKPVLGPNNTIAMREPDNKFILKILKKLKEPITATSANISKKPPAYISKEVIDYFKEEPSPDYFINFGDLPKRPVSTIMDLTKDFRMLRTGKIKEKEIKETLKKVISLPRIPPRRTGEASRGLNVT